jgi:hypothetical protein
MASNHSRALDPPIPKRCQSVLYLFLEGFELKTPLLSIYPSESHGGSKRLQLYISEASVLRVAQTLQPLHMSH